MVKEETNYINKVVENNINSFGIDTTTTVIKLENGNLVLHSPGEATKELIEEIEKLGNTVVGIIAPNLQHWLGCKSWSEIYPKAMVYVAPEAEGECLLEKLGLQNSSRAQVLDKKGKTIIVSFLTAST